MKNSNFNLDSRMLVIPKDNKALEANSRFVSTYIHANTYLIQGSKSDINEYIASKDCLDSRVCLFPECEWIIDYKYLGDVSVGTPIHFDLRLKDREYIYYRLEGDLPDGLKFESGVLSGSSREITDVIDLTIVARKRRYFSKEKTRTFQLRFYQGINNARSFMDNDYIRLGYGPALIDYDSKETYYRVFESSGKNTGRPIDEAADAARKILRRAQGKPIELLVSGGIDSQSMVQAFVKAGVPFHATLMIDIHGCNKEDVHYAALFFEKLGRPLKKRIIDFAKYIRSYKYLESAFTYRFNNPEYGLLLGLMDLKKSFPVYAGRPISISQALDQSRVIGLAVDETWSRARYLERHRGDGCPEFLIFTPELMESFLKTDYARQFPNGQPWLYQDKLQLLASGGFDISLAPPTKLTGFENLEYQFESDHFGNELWLHHRGPLKHRFPNGPRRNAVPIVDDKIGPWRPEKLKTYEDGFSFRYVSKYNIADFH